MLSWNSDFSIAHPKAPTLPPLEFSPDISNHHNRITRKQALHGLEIRIPISSINGITSHDHFKIDYLDSFGHWSVFGHTFFTQYVRSHEKLTDNAVSLIARIPFFELEEKIVQCSKGILSLRYSMRKEEEIDDTIAISAIQNVIYTPFYVPPIANFRPTPIFSEIDLDEIESEDWVIRYDKHHPVVDVHLPFSSMLAGKEVEMTLVLRDQNELDPMAELFQVRVPLLTSTAPTLFRFDLSISGIQPSLLAQVKTASAFYRLLHTEQPGSNPQADVRFEYLKERYK